jgi:hypothetical protein
MDFMQTMINHVATLANLGGSTYILTGCVESGMSVSSGYVVINGEVMPFTGGTKQTTVYIKEVRRDVDASGYHFPQVYKTRTCEFGLGTSQLNWADFKRVSTNKALQDAIDAINTELNNLKGIPAGLICMWSGDPGNVPDGWALCDGDGGRPNLLGRFVVGFHPTDQDYNQIGKPNAGNKTVTLTENNIPKHTMQFFNSDDDSGGIGSYGITRGDRIGTRGADGNDNSTYIYNTSPYGKANPDPIDIRPAYYVLAYIIKL